MILTLVFFLLAVILVVVQTTVLQYLPSGFARPDLAFLLVAFAAYRLPWIPGILVVFTVGWVLDVVAGINLGIYPLEFLFVYISLKVVTLNSPVKESVYQIPMVGLSYFLLQMIVYFLSSLTLDHAIQQWSWGNVVQETVLLVLAAIPCFVLFNSLYEYLQMRIARSRPARRVRKRL